MMVRECAGQYCHHFKRGAEGGSTTKTAASLDQRPWDRMTCAAICCTLPEGQVPWGSREIK